MRYPGIIEIVPGPNGWGVYMTDIQAGYILYQCPGCGRIEKHAMVSIYVPNTTCGCNSPTCVYMMNIIGSWKHPNWVEFDEQWYWADKGVITEIPYIMKTEEELWLEKWETEQLQIPPPLNEGKGNYAQDVKVSTLGKFQFWISKIQNFWKGKGKNLLLS